MPEPAELHASLILSYFSCLNPSRYQALLSFYRSAITCIEIGAKDWADNGLIAAECLGELSQEWTKAEHFAEKEQKEIESTPVRVILWQDPGYPTLLRTVAAAPPIIYVQGKGLSEGAIPLALVGSRRPTYYGEKVARTLTGDLVDCGITTVSGLARGIDSHVHGETIKRGGTTWAVLGSGLLNLYPRENRALAEKILENGALISEFALHTPPFQGHFPRRNRIIAGLSHATIVIEGDEKSGSLITARLATEAGRDVFAVPGPIFSSLSRGPHRLIQSGAALITSVDDVLDELPEHVRSRLISKPLNVCALPDFQTNGHQNLLNELESTALSRDVLAARVKLSPQALSAILLELELAGVVRILPGGIVERT